MKIRNILFIVTALSLIITVTIYSIFIKEQMLVSVYENRTMANFNTLNQTKFIDGTFQANLEDALADQFYNRYEIVNYKKQLDLQLGSLFFPPSKDAYKLNKVGDTKIYRIGDSNFMMNGLIPENLDYIERVENRISQINQLAKDYPDLGIFVYKPTQIHETDLFDEINETKSLGPTLSNLLLDKLTVPYSQFEIDSLDQYKNSFYATDHHWNYNGSQIGYMQIVEMMLGDKELAIQPISLNCFDEPLFSGTFSAQTAYVLPGENFCVYGYNNQPYHVINKDGEIITDIEDSTSFIDRDISKIYDGYYYLHAYNYYGNESVWVSDSDDVESKETLLIIGDSYAPPILSLLTNHYSKIFYINPHTYFLENDWQYFDYDQFIADNNIENVLFMYTIENYFFADEWDEFRYTKYDVHRTGDN